MLLPAPTACNSRNVAICPIDGCRETTFLRPENLHYCAACRHGWVEDAETPAQYEQQYFGSIYTRPREYDAWLARRYADILSVSRGLIPSLRTSLDVGCGQGELVHYFSAHGLKAEGLETSVRYSADCRARGL